MAEPRIPDHPWIWLYTRGPLRSCALCGWGPQAAHHVRAKTQEPTHG